MVRLGEHDFAQTTDKQYQDVLIERYTAHEHYDSSLMINDIALLDLDHDVQFNGKIVYSNLQSKNQYDHRLLFFTCRPYNSRLFASQW